MIENLLGARATGVRIAGWSGAALIMLAPLVAMGLTDEVDWGGEDFVFAGLLIGVTGGLFELTVRARPSAAYRAGVALALAATFLLIWVNAAVGFIGSEDNPANAMFGGVLGIALLGSVAARFRARGMAWTMSAAAVAQGAAGVAALVLGHFVILPTAVFCALWYGSALLFEKAAREPA